MGPGRVQGSTRVVPLQDPPSSHTPGTPLPSPPRSRRRSAVSAAVYSGLNMVVGLNPVGQLSLSAHFSDIQGITEVYNLSEIGRINNHSSFPGTK